MLVLRRDLFFCLVLCAFISNCFALDGLWKDICADGKCYGGVMSVCELDNEIYGRYSDIGFIRGTRKDDKVQGQWFEAGYSQRNHGGFEWRLLGDNAFTGSWWFSDRQCDRFGWSSEKIDPSTPSFAQCGVLLNSRGDNGNLYQGHWISDSGNNEMFICDDQRAYFHGSGTFEGVKINIAGKSFLDGEVLSASYWTTQTQGIMLMNLLSTVDLVVSWWEVEINEFALGRFGESNLHSADIFRRADVEDLLEACAVHRNIGGLDWNGSWFDTRYGDGKFFTCEDGNVANGVFSEIGWIEGTALTYDDEDVMVGEYYVSGARDDSDQGIFQIQMVNHGHSFEGIYFVDGEEVLWRADRIDGTSAFSDKCHVPDVEQTVGGKWFYGKHASDIMDICIKEDGSVEMSYSYDNGEFEGYGIGSISGSGPHSIRMTWWEDKADGIAMYRITKPGRLTEFFWEDINISFDLDYQICDDEEVNFTYWGRHSVNTLRLMSSEQDEDACARNRKLFNTRVFEIDSSSSSFLFVPSIILLLFISVF